MSLFIETIRIENGRIHNLSYHNRRMNETRRNVLCQTDVLDLNDYIRPVNYRERTKCRVEYDVDIRPITSAQYPLCGWLSMTKPTIGIKAEIGVC